jgi:N6-adenosine-specific RNA methylase IME4
MTTRRRQTDQLELFRVGPFVVEFMGLRVNGTPPEEQWALAFTQIARSRDGIQWAIGDMLLYADQRGYRDEAVEGAMDATGLKRGTLQNIKSVCRTFPPEKRVGTLSYSHHALAAGFEESERDELLARAARNRLSWEEMRGETRRMRRDQYRVREWPAGKYGVMLSDAPWEHEENALPPSRATENHYPTMTAEQLIDLAPRVRELAGPDCVHYFWTTTAKLVSGEARAVWEAWGFEARSAHVWVKDLMGLGAWVRNRHEHLVICVKGSPRTPEEDMRPDSVITAARGEHSEKPVEAYEVIERCYVGVPRVELFARPPYREGWATWGHELIPAAERGIRVRDREEATA